MIDLKDEVLFTFGGLNNISKELLFDWFDMKYKSLLNSIEAAQNMYKQAFEGQEDKISSLINERENYKELYLKNKEELDRLKDKDSCYLTISMLAEQLKEAQAKQDCLESQNLILKESLKTMEDQRDSYRKLAESFADLCRPAPVDLSGYVETPSKCKMENLNGKLTLIDKGYYKLLVLSDDKVEMTILGNVEYHYTLADFTLKEFDTYYCLWRDGSSPFMRVNKFTREVTKL